MMRSWCSAALPTAACMHAVPAAQLRLQLPASLTIGEFRQESFQLHFRDARSAGFRRVGVRQGRAGAGAFGRVVLKSKHIGGTPAERSKEGNPG